MLPPGEGPAFSSCADWLKPPTALNSAQGGGTHGTRHQVLNSVSIFPLDWHPQVQLWGGRDDSGLGGGLAHELHTHVPTLVCQLWLWLSAVHHGHQATLQRNPRFTFCTTQWREEKAPQSTASSTMPPSLPFSRPLTGAHASWYQGPYRKVKPRTIPGNQRPLTGVGLAGLKLGPSKKFCNYTMHWKITENK